MKNIRLYILVCFAWITFGTQAQSVLSGYVLDESKTPIPFAKIFIKNSADQRTLADVNGYYEIRVFPGEYFLVFSALGYEERESYIAVDEKNVQRNMQLFPSKIQDLTEMQIAVKKSNPGREIMLEVVKKREKINPWNYPHTTNVYLKATEKIIPKTENQKTKKKEENPEEVKPPGDIEDPFATAPKKPDIANNMNLVEVQLTRNFSPPNKVKEIRNAYDKRGNDKFLYYTTTVKSNFNFFQNLLFLDDLHQSPISSPISGPGILSYKYRLEEQYEENGKRINRIKIIPRSTSTSTLEGYIWVVDSTWLVQKIELSLQKGNLLVYDYFHIKQTYSTPGDSICILTSQELTYGLKTKSNQSIGKTIADFSNYNFDTKFNAKFFGNELAVTEKEAYEKDSTFWQQNRKIELSEEEKSFILTKDSIRDAHNRKEYTDSIDAIFNKVTALKVLWYGIDKRNREKRVQWSLSSVAGTIRPIYIAGPRIAPSFYYFKKWANETSIDSYTEMTLGFLNKDLKGRTWWRYRYNPFHFGTAKFSFSHDFDAIRSFDAITQIYKRENFIESTTGSIGNDYELFNGFYTDINFEFSERRSLKGYKFLTFLDNTLPNNDPTEFKGYQAAIAEITFSYTPQQKYMREPNRKVVLGSKFPTFYATFEQGIPNLFGSDVNHQYLRVGLLQTFKIGTLGTSSYHLTSGKFLSAKNLQFADFKFQRRSDPIWFSNPLYSFQGLDSSLQSKDIFYEGHFVHHDNGAIINKIPFMKKTQIGLVLGIGGLYVKEFDWQHYEFLVGLERNIKFSRKRLRIGIYGVLSDGNKIAPKANWKVSFAVLDDRNMKWNF